MRRLGLIFLFFVLLLGLGVGGVLLASGDPVYTAKRWWSVGRYERYDAMIREAARKHGVDPRLVKAVVWRESEFHPHMVGKSGERGLMQVGEGAAADWVRVNKIETFVPTDLFSPRMNLEIGTWYLSQALKRWAAKDDPVPFALAEYNAGKRRVDRWIAEAKKAAADRGEEGVEIGSEALRNQMDFPTTRFYIETIMDRLSFYRKQGDL